MISRSCSHLSGTYPHLPVATNAKGNANNDQGPCTKCSARHTKPTGRVQYTHRDHPHHWPRAFCRGSVTRGREDIISFPPPPFPLSPQTEQSVVSGYQQHDSRAPGSGNSGRVSRYRDLVSGNRDLVSGYRDLVSGYRDLVSGYRDLVSGYRAVVSRYRDLVSGYRAVVSRYRTPPPLVSGYRDPPLGSRGIESSSIGEFVLPIPRDYTLQLAAGTRGA